MVIVKILVKDIRNGEDKIIGCVIPNDNNLRHMKYNRFKSILGCDYEYVATFKLITFEDLDYDLDMCFIGNINKVKEVEW